MTDTDASLLAKLEELAKKATVEIVRISLTGGRGWRMSIPARQDDSDLLFHDLAECATQAADALRRSGEALRRLQEENDQLKGKTRPSAAGKTEA